MPEVVSGLKMLLNSSVTNTPLLSVSCCFYFVSPLLSSLKETVFFFLARLPFEALSMTLSIIENLPSEESEINLFMREPSEPEPCERVMDLLMEVVTKKLKLLVEWPNLAN